jgi:Ig-like domain from next to BRCA1 gene/Helix-turn-helix domain
VNHPEHDKVNRDRTGDRSTTTTAPGTNAGAARPPPLRPRVRSPARQAESRATRSERLGLYRRQQTRTATAGCVVRSSGARGQIIGPNHAEAPVVVDRTRSPLSTPTTLLTNLQQCRTMTRWPLPPPLVPRQPTTVLGWSMQKLRIVHGATVREVARSFGCSPSHISRVERGGAKPSRALVQFYEETFGGDGMLSSLLEVTDHAGEQKRQRAHGNRRRQPRATPGDASRFLEDTVAHGSVFSPGEFFIKSWTIQNTGSVPWVKRRLERQGPLTGPGLITSPRYTEVADTEPSEVCRVEILLKAPSYDCTSIAYFKMVGADGYLSFPDDYSLGLDVLVLTRGQLQPGTKAR